MAVIRVFSLSFLFSVGTRIPKKEKRSLLTVKKCEVFVKTKKHKNKTNKQKTSPQKNNDLLKLVN